MVLQDFYFIAEIVAAIAVVASLLFVGVQLRQTTSATRSANMHAALDNWTQISLTMANSPDLEGAMRAGTRPGLNFDRLSTEEVRFHYYMVAGMKIIEGNFLQWRGGNFSDELWVGFRQSLVEMFATNTGWHDYWQAMSNLHSEPFQKLIAEVRAEAEVRYDQLKQANGGAAGHQ